MARHDCEVWAVTGDDRVVENEADGGDSRVFERKRPRGNVVIEEKECKRVKTPDSGDTVAVFLAPKETMKMIDCAGDKNAVECRRG